MAKLFLVKNGQSIFNLENRFTGWVDIGLDRKGFEQVKKIGEKLKNIKFNIIFTSKLIRAEQTLYEILNSNNSSNKIRKEHVDNFELYNSFFKLEKGENEILLHSSDKLNERFYGDLQGLNKTDTIKRFGEKQVSLWENGFDVTPPGGESLKDTIKRTLPYYEKKIIPYLKENKNVLIVAHNNSLKSIIKKIENISDEEISKLELKTEEIIIYTFSNNKDKPKKEII